MRRPDNEPLLFDLPLDRPARDGDAEPVLDRQKPRAPRSQPPAKADGAAGAPGRKAATTAAEPSPAPRLPLASAAALPTRPGLPPARGPLAPELDAELDAAAPDAGIGAASPSLEGRAGIGRRAAAGAADLLVHVAVAIVALAGCRALGVAPAIRDWPAFGVFLLSFSFLYTVVPLAFWGHTLGMTWAGLTAESTGGEPLSFDQTARRWLGALLTLAVAGLPLLLALTGRSLADRLSGSRTLAGSA